MFSFKGHKLLMTAMILLVSSSGWTCEILRTGTVVTDKFRNGKVKTLKSISSLSEIYGDNSPLYNLLLAKDFIKSKKWDVNEISIETKIKSGALDLKKQTHVELENWKDDIRFLILKDFDAEKFKGKVYSLLSLKDKKLLANQIEIVVFYKQKEFCTHKMSIDNH